jgi:hypothetical protein
MAATGRPDGTAPTASDIAAQLQQAGLVRLVAGATGDGVAAVGLLTEALESVDVAYHSSVVALPAPTDRATDADITIALGRPVADADIELGTDGTPASATALSISAELGAVDYELGVAGITAAGVHPSSDLLGTASERGIDRQPGLATPTGDLSDGLAHSGLVHTSFSGEPETAAEILASAGVERQRSELDEESLRRVASLVAVSVCEDEQAGTAATEALEQFLRPLVAPGGRFETVEGYGDVLDATARARPNLAVALALGVADVETALDTWRTQNRRAHEAIRSASTGRYDGLYVVRCPGNCPLGTVARLVAAYRSPEPLVVALDDTGAVATGSGVSSLDHIGDHVARTAKRVGGAGNGTATTGRATFDVDPTEFVAAFREEL